MACGRGGHHLTNVVLHAGCAVLLFLLLLEMTGGLWRSGFVAAVFALHPLRVESVAWAAELKDVLSGVFFMLILWAYARNARRAEFRWRYAAVMLWLALGLMSKPMLVSVPFVLLLLDYWPLGRLETGKQLPGLFREKLPLFALSALSCVATVFAQRQAIQPMGDFPLSTRIGNALVAYVVYMGKLVYPWHLAALYPLSKEGPPAWQVMDAALLLAAVTAGAYVVRRKQPYLLTGWLWYLGMLAPVIGILQVGQQAYADRYTYLPEIGLCFAGSWAAAAWAGQRWVPRMMLGCAAVVILCALAVAAHRQTAYWSDSATLWTHTLACTQDNFGAHDNLGNLLLGQGKPEQAIAEYGEALRINPTYADAHSNIGAALLKEGRTAEATAEFREALQIDPANGKAHSNLGTVLFQQGHTEEAIAEYRAALRSNPDYAEVHNNLGSALLQEGKPEEAVAEYGEALRINPDYAKAHDNLGNTLRQQGRTQESVTEYNAALRTDPAYADAHKDLGIALLQQGRTAEAIDHTEKALALQPADAGAENNLAWILATAPDASLRDGAKAVELATQASKSTGGNNPIILRTLAAANAETGKFPEAVQIARRALDQAEAEKAAPLAEALRRDIKLYESRRRFEPVR
jgi:tetratricopeptide (TPR) repeat protein